MVLYDASDWVGANDDRCLVDCDGGTGLDAIADVTVVETEAGPLDAGGDGASARGCGIPGRGPAMIDAGSFCIDATEVTQAQYAQFVAATAGDTSGQPPECAWNVAFRPPVNCPYDPVGRADLPVQGPDWCDAYAFCRWAGKRLCGARGDGGALPESEPASPITSEWTAACTNFDDGLHNYPYGNTFEASRCNVRDAELDGAVPVRSLAGCAGGLDGLHDMSGNLWEWVNQCDSNGKGNAPEDRCRLQGGSYGSSSAQSRCAGTYHPTRDGNRECQLGIRCCADP